MKLFLALAILSAFVANGSAAFADIVPFDPSEPHGRPVPPQQAPDKKDEKPKEKPKEKSKEKPKEKEKDKDKSKEEKKK